MNESGTVDPSKVGDPEVVVRAFEDSPAIHAVFEGPEHRFVAVNAATRRLLGDRQVLGVPCRVAVPELNGQQLFDRLDEVYSSGHPVTARDRRVRIDRYSDLEWFVTFTMSPWRYPDGAVRGVIVQAVDTTPEVLARRRAEARGGEYQRRYRAALEVIDELQRALLPTSLPVLPQVELAARYLVADVEYAAGGDWFDGFVLTDHRLAVMVGDVVGHGVAAAAVMSQLRAVFSHVMESGAELEDALRQLDRFAARTPGALAATVCVMVCDPGTGKLTYATCGHPAPLVIGSDGQPRWLPTTGHRPLGTGNPKPARTDLLAVDDLLLLYSDGLVERPDRSWESGLALLATVAGEAVTNRHPHGGGSMTERVCTRTVELMTRSGYLDDVTVLAVQRRATPIPPWYQEYPAEAAELSRVRADLRRWLDGLMVSVEDELALTLAASEVTANCVEHAYRDGTQGLMRVQANLTTAGEALLVIADDGRWRTPKLSPSGRGRGLTMVADATDDLSIDHDHGGTVVRLRRRLHRPVDSPNASDAPQIPDAAFSVAFTVDPEPVLSVVGPVDLTCADELRREIQLASRMSHAPVTVDLTGVTYLGSAGVQVLLAATEDVTVSAAGDGMAAEDGMATEDGKAPIRLSAAVGTPAEYVLDLIGLAWQPVRSRDARGTSGP